MRIAIAALFIVGCSASGNAAFLGPCPFRDGGWPDTGSIYMGPFPVMIPACPEPFTCIPSGVCGIACETDDECRAMQDGEHPGTECRAGRGCAFTCANDGECPAHLRCSGAHYCEG